MPAADAHEERGRVRRRRVAAGFLVGLLLVGLELITDAVLPPSHVRATALDRALVLAPLPFLGGLFGLVFARLWWLGAAFAVVGAGRVGLHLSMGLRAQRMAYAAHWDEILAGLTLLAVLALRFIESRRRLRVGLAVLTVPVALATLSMAAFGYRGDYGPVREGVIQVAAVFMLLVIAPFVPAPPRRTLGLAFAVTAVAAVTGAFAVGHRQDLRDWAFYRTSLADAYVAPIWTRTGPALPTAAPDDAYRKSPYFGTEAQLETSRRLFAERRPRGVLFLTVDAMRHDVIGREVGGRPVTPFLDSLAATGYRFTRCYAPSNITNATFLAIFAGIYPSEILHHPLGVDDMPVVTQRLRDAGVQCRGVFYEVVAAGGIYKDTAENPSLQFEPELLIGQEDFAPEDLAGLLAPEGDGRWFSFAHYMRPHEPYDSAAPEFAAGGSPFERYAAEVRQADDEIRRLIELLAARGLTDDLWIVVSADHGEEFGEHGLTFHGRQLFDESIRVPLIIAGPGVPTGVCDDPVSLIDLAPTLDEIFETGDAEAPPLSGRSLLPFPAGVQDPDRRDAVAAEMPGVKQSMRQRALIARDRKTVLNFERKTLHRYDLRADPGERVNVADGHAAEIRADVAILEALIAGVEAHRADEEFPVDLVEELERLPREELRARVAATGDADLTTAVAYFAPLATPNGARTLAGELEGSGRLDDTRRLLLRLATGERGEALAAAAAALLASTRDPIVAVAIYDALRRRDDDRALDARPPRFASRHARLAIDLAFETYRASFGNVSMNFRIVHAAHLSPLALNRRLGADYLWVLAEPISIPEVAALYVSDWRDAVTLRRRASLVRSLLRVGTEEALEAVAGTLRSGSREERAAVLAAAASGIAPPRGVTVLRHEEPLPLPCPAIEGARAGDTIAIFLEPAPDAPLPWTARLATESGSTPLDLGEVRPGRPLLVTLAGEPGAPLTLRLEDPSAALSLRAVAILRAP